MEATDAALGFAALSQETRLNLMRLLATRGAWRVLLALVRTGRYEPAKTDRIAR